MSVCRDCLCTSDALHNKNSQWCFWASVCARHCALATQCSDLSWQFSHWSLANEGPKRFLHHLCPICSKSHLLHCYTLDPGIVSYCPKTKTLQLEMCIYYIKTNWPDSCKLLPIGCKCRILKFYSHSISLVHLQRTIEYGPVPWY